MCRGVDLEKEYISIREFAARANISRQRAYKLVSKKLQGYCKIIGEKKIIDISALEELKKVVDNGQPVDKCIGDNCNPVDNSKKVSLQQSLDSVDDFNCRYSNKTVGNGQPVDKCMGNNCQLIDKSIEKTIDTLRDQLKIKDEQIFELQSIIKSLQEQQVSLTKSLANSQALHAGTIQEHIDSKVEKESKKGFWSWLFRKRN